MEERSESREIYYKYLEAALIITCGMYMHLSKISIIELKCTKLVGLQPNLSSAIFTLSLLSVLAVIRPYWPSVLKKPSRFFRLLLELALTLYLTDLILHQVWVPLLRALDYICSFLADYMVIVNNEIFYNQMPNLSKWIRNDFFYLTRLALAVIAFYFMAEVTGLFDKIRTEIVTRCSPECNRSDYYISPEQSTSYSRLSRFCDVEEEPELQIRPTKRRRRRKRNSPRRSSLWMGHENEEFNC